jgi:hypothetical protein
MIRFALIVIVSIAAVACDSVTPDLPMSTPLAVAPTLRPDIACEIEQGMRLVEIMPPRFAGDDFHYRVERTGAMSKEDEAAIVKKCFALLPEDPPQTDEEVVAIYDRWLEERACLVRLGYAPDPPPPLEQFLVDWRTGPWSPVDGVDTRRWTTDEFKIAKNLCILEMLEQR